MGAVSNSLDIGGHLVRILCWMLGEIHNTLPDGDKFGAAIANMVPMSAEHGQDLRDAPRDAGRGNDKLSGTMGQLRARYRVYSVVESCGIKPCGFSCGGTTCQSFSAPQFWTPSQPRSPGSAAHHDDDTVVRPILPPVMPFRCLCMRSGRGFKNAHKWLDSF